MTRACYRRGEAAGRPGYYETPDCPCVAIRAAGYGSPWGTSRIGRPAAGTQDERCAGATWYDGWTADAASVPGGSRRAQPGKGRPEVLCFVLRTQATEVECLRLTHNNTPHDKHDTNINKKIFKTAPTGYFEIPHHLTLVPSTAMGGNLHRFISTNRPWGRRKRKRARCSKRRRRSQTRRSPALASARPASGAGPGSIWVGCRRKRGTGSAAGCNRTTQEQGLPPLRFKVKLPPSLRCQPPPTTTTYAFLPPLLSRSATGPGSGVYRSGNGAWGRRRLRRRCRREFVLSRGWVGISNPARGRPLRTCTLRLGSLGAMRVTMTSKLDCYSKGM